MRFVARNEFINKRKANKIVSPILSLFLTTPWTVKYSEHFSEFLPSYSVAQPPPLKAGTWRKWVCGFFNDNLKNRVCPSDVDTKHSTKHWAQQTKSSQPFAAILACFKRKEKVNCTISVVDIYVALVVALCNLTKCFFFFLWVVCHCKTVNILLVLCFCFSLFI